MNLPPECDFSEKWNDARIFSHDAKGAQDGTRGIRTYTGTAAKIMVALGYALEVPIKENGKITCTIVVNKESARKFFSSKSEKPEESSISSLINNYITKQRGKFPSLPMKATEWTVSPKEYAKKKEAELEAAAKRRAQAYDADASSFATKVSQFFTPADPSSRITSQDIVDAFRDCKATPWTGHIMDFVEECLEEGHVQVEQGTTPEQALEHFTQSLRAKISDELASLPRQADEITQEFDAIKKERELIFLELNSCLKSPEPTETPVQKAQLGKNILNKLDAVNLAQIKDRAELRNSLFIPGKLQQATNLVTQLSETNARKKWLNSSDKQYVKGKETPYRADLEKINEILANQAAKTALLQCFKTT